MSEWLRAWVRWRVRRPMVGAYWRGGEWDGLAWYVAHDEWLHQRPRLGLVRQNGR